MTTDVVEEARAGFVERVQQHANHMSSHMSVVPVSVGALAPADPAGKIAAFDAEQVKAGRQMTGEEATKHQARTEHFRNQVAFAKALQPSLDKDGFVDSRILNKCTPLLHGFTFPEGIAVRAVEAFKMTAIAKRAGFTQSELDRFITAERELGFA